MKKYSLLLSSLMLAAANSLACSFPASTLDQQTEKADEIFIATLIEAKLLPKDSRHEWPWIEGRFQVKNLAQLHDVAAKMIALRDEFLAGGLVVREFEPYDGAGEARVWWVDGEPALVGPHPDSPDADVSPDLDGVAPAVRSLGCRFITTDLARRTDGVWRVVEVGDVQVSDLPSSVDAMDLYAHLPVPD